MESRAQGLHLGAWRWSPGWLRWSPVFLLLLIACSPPPKNQHNYKTIFGRDYKNAFEILNTNSWWADTLNSNGIDPDFGLAIIFPELIRYSSIRDYMETRALEVLYVQYGADYADFSVGLFQMKPTFAEQIEADIQNFNLGGNIPALSFPESIRRDTPEARRERVLRLKDERMQLHYLDAFIRIMDKIFPGQAALPEADKLVFYATAYNTGYFKEERIIMNEMELKRFYSGMKEPGEKYCYSAIALDYYHSRLKQNED